MKVVPTIAAKRDLHIRRKSTHYLSSFLTDMIIFADVKKNCSGLQALSPFGVMSLFQPSMWSISRQKGLKKQLQFVLLYRLICLCRQWCWVHAFQTGAAWWSAHGPVQSSRWDVHTPYSATLSFATIWIPNWHQSNKWCITLSPERQGQPHKVSMCNPSATTLDNSSGIVISLVTINSFRTSSFDTSSP